MARELSQTAQDQITAKALSVRFIFKINGTNYTSYVKNWSLSFDKNYGSAAASFTLINNDGFFNEGETNALYVGDVVELIEYFQGDSFEFKKFYGVISQRGVSKRGDDRNITLQCLDYISVLKNWNLDLAVEGDKEEVRNEEMEPVYLPAPNDALAQLFNFANNAIADNPLPLIKFQDKNHEDFTDDQFDGFQIYYDVGQMKLGAPLNVRDNYKVMATYFHYTRGLFIEDVIESILTAVDGYGNYLFGESSAQAIIDNHLTDTFQNVEGAVDDILVTNLVDFEADIETQLTQDYSPTDEYTTTLAEPYQANEEDYDPTIMYLTDISDFEFVSGSGIEGTAKIGDYTITYQGTGSGNTLTGVVVTPIERNFRAGVTITRITDVENTELYVSDITGFPVPESGGDNIQISINGDITTYNDITAASGGGYILGGIPTSGSYALKAKASGSYVKYTDTYAPGTLWALRYNNLTSTLDTSDFTLPSGYTGEVVYLDQRYGRIILSEPVADFLNDTILCHTDYTFKTLQATGIEINRKVFRERELDNRFEAINFLRKYLAPNYIIRTIGDDKIWASYLTQKSRADYDLNLITDMDYLEDEDLFTRSIIWTKNENPNNVMFGDDVDYDVDNLDAYTGIASKEELMYIGDEKSGILSEAAQTYLTEAAQFDGTDPTVDVINYIKDKYIIKDFASQPTTGMRIYATPISNEYGKIIADTVTPLIWLNGIPVDNKVHRIDSVPVKIRQTVKTVTEGGGKSKETSTYTYYYYTVFFPHSSIEPTQPIHLYDLQGTLQYTIEPNDPNMDYGTGVWTLPGMEQNAIAETISTAGYDVFYDSSKVEIDYEDVVFKVDKSLVPNPDELVVRATFEYWSIAVGVRDIRAVVDGRRDTQLQLQFFGSPISGFHLATIDMGAVYDVQAIDLVGGFYKPDEYRKFDVDFTVSMQSSINGTDFFPISDKTEQFRVSGGKAITFEEADLGIGLQARYLKFNLYDVARVNYGKGRYVVAVTEISVYNNIVLKGEATLIATTTLAAPVAFGDTEVYLTNTHGFSEPESAEEETAYFGKDVSFTYTGIESGNVLTGCEISTGTSEAAGTLVTQSLAADTTVYDEDELLPKLGDRVSKQNQINDRNLYSQAETDALSKAFLLEFYKDHTKAKVNVMYSPHLQIGQTVNVNDPYNNKVNVKYFIESVRERAQGVTSLVLARYPAS